MLRIPRVFLCVLLTVVLGGILAGCSPAADPLAGTSWRLLGWTVSSIDPATVNITAQFADGRIAGTSAVNSYSADYALGSGGAITLGDIVHTEMAGPEPLMRAENAYMELLAKVRSYRLEGDALTLLDEGGNDSLIFERVKN